MRQEGRGKTGNGKSREEVKKKKESKNKPAIVPGHGFSIQERGVRRNEKDKPDESRSSISSIRNRSPCRGQGMPVGRKHAEAGSGSDHSTHTGSFTCRGRHPVPGGRKHIRHSD